MRKFGKKELDIIESKLTDYLVPRLIAAKKDDEIDEERDADIDREEDAKEKEEVEITPEDVEEEIIDKVDSDEVKEVAENVAEDIADAIADISEEMNVTPGEAIEVVKDVLGDEESKEEIVEASRRLARRRSARKAKVSLAKRKTGKQYIVSEYEGGEQVWESKPISSFKEACALADKIYERDYDKYVDPEIGNEEYWFRVMVFDADDEYLEDPLYASHEPDEG